MAQHKDDTTLEAQRSKLKAPPMFMVLLVNEAYPPRECVVVVGQTYLSALTGIEQVLDGVPVRIAGRRRDGSSGCYAPGSMGSRLLKRAWVQNSGAAPCRDN